MAQTKICNSCKEEKTIDEYYKHPMGLYGTQPLCKICHREKVKENRKANADHYRNYEKQRAMLPHRVKARKEYAKTEHGYQIIKEIKKNWAKRNYPKRKAQNMVNNALRDGKITKPSKCECGRTGRIEGHHDDYTKPLEVRWLCVPCHKQAHR